MRPNLKIIDPNAVIRMQRERAYPSQIYSVPSRSTTILESLLAAAVVALLLGGFWYGAWIWGLSRLVCG